MGLALAAAAPLLSAGCAGLDQPASSSRAARVDLGARPRLDVRPRTIVQEGAGRDVRFVLAAADPPPTPKTLSAGVAAPAAQSTRIAPALAAASHSLAPANGTAARVARVVEPMRVRALVGSVYFEVGESRLVPAALATIANALRWAAHDDRLVLTAYTDPRGTAAGNRQLADARAAAVADALERRGVVPARLIVLSRPQCCVVGASAEGRFVEYRRVDIEILRS